jgi:hypothetical protein
MKEHMKETEAKPALRISHIVYGRQASGNRVLYLLDPKGQGTERFVAESVVLKRWRKRQFPAHTFSGERLSSTLWRAVAKAFGTKAKALCKLSLDQIAATAENSRELLSADGFLKLASPQTLHALFAVCGPERLQAILDKHLSEDHKGKSGIPDLFLFATSDSTGLPTIARFVEVKKPEEPVSPVQMAEIAFLNQMGLHARVLRLVERE